jgi:predicted nucleic acid-binding protein
VTVIVDASVAVKWVAEEEGTNAAVRVQLEEQLAAPDFLILECANALRTKARRGELTRQDAEAALATIRATPIQLFAASDYAAAAQVLAFDLNHSVYDCLYLAVALAERIILITADRAFAERVTRHGIHAHAVRLLEPM